ncbi:MAG: zinc-dependent metalloprotease family protein [Phycisphaerales bacterium]
MELAIAIGTSLLSARRVRAAAALGLLALAGGSPALAAITHRVTIQPIQVRRDDGTGAANAGRVLWEGYADKIWDQAGIDVEFLSWRTLDKTSYLSVDNVAEFTSLTRDVGNQQHATASVINMYFVNSQYADSNEITYGRAWVGGNGIVISDPTFSFASGLGRLDTLAHEIGHNLGLSHGGGALRLMADGNVRTIPTALGDVFPDGVKTDQLLAGEITTATGSGFSIAVPTPGSLAILGVSGPIASRRRRG